MQSEPSTTPPLARRWLDYRRKRFWGAAFVLLYVLAGFFLAPMILRPRIVAAAQDGLGRPVTLEGVAVNPLTLSVDLRGFRVIEKDGSPLVGFDRLHIRLSIDSLLHWAWSFGNITLEGFKGDIVRYGAGDTNIGRLMPASSPSEKPAKTSPRLLIHHLSIKNAAANFTDRVPATPFTTQIGPVNAEIDQLGTLPDETGQQHVVIGLEKGATLEWTGQSSLDPLSSSGRIKAKGPYLPLLARYFGEAYKVAVPSGNLDADLDYRLREQQDGALDAAIDHLTIGLSNLVAQFEEGGNKIEIASAALTAESLTNKADAAFPFSLSADLAAGGTVKLQGKAGIPPSVGLDAKLTVADLPLAAAQPYLHDLAKLTIQDGKIEGEGDVKFTQPDGLKVAGRGEVRSLKLQDEVEQTPVVSWDRLGIDHYSYYQSANELRIAQVTLEGPYLRFQVAKDHSTNFSHIIVPATPAKAPPAAAAKAASPMKISVGKINVASGSADYGDASLPLPFATHISNLQGNVSALASDTASPSSVSLKGQVNQYGEADIYGHINPFNPTKGMNMNVVFRNVAFPTLSPYTAKFAGWRIAKGSLDVEAQYKIDGTKLAGKNRVVIRDMELGEKMEVPGALDLPLDLLVSLLKDDEGKIDIDIPITGDVADPQFDFGSVVTKEVGDLLGNIISSPFRALAGLFGGGGEALDHIDFPAGRADLEPPEKEKLQHVAELMQKKPKIGLVVAGVTDKQVDRRKLQKDAVDAAMAKELGDHDTVSRQRRFLEEQFALRVGKDKLAAVKQPFAQAGDDDPGYVAALRTEVAKTEPVDDAALTALAQSRGKAVADALSQIPGFDAKRVTVRGTQDAKSDDDYHVPLKLEAAQK